MKENVLDCKKIVSKERNAKKRGKMRDEFEEK